MNSVLKHWEAQAIWMPAEIFKTLFDWSGLNVTVSTHKPREHIVYKMIIGRHTDNSPLKPMDEIKNKANHLIMKGVLSQKVDQITHYETALNHLKVALSEDGKGRAEPIIGVMHMFSVCASQAWRIKVLNQTGEGETKK